VPRLRISYLMIFVAIAALNSWAVRLWYQLRPDGNGVHNTVEVLTYGVRCYSRPSLEFTACGIIRAGSDEGCLGGPPRDGKVQQR
jgi:hypothetical protein